jgi:hypothetical protein
MVTAKCQMMQNARQMTENGVSKMRKHVRQKKRSTFNDRKTAKHGKRAAIPLVRATT